MNSVTKITSVLIQEELIVSRKQSTFHTKYFTYTTKIDTSVCVCHGSLNCSLMTFSQVLYFDLHVFHESLMQQYRTMFFLKPHYAPGDRVCPYNAYNKENYKRMGMGTCLFDFHKLLWEKAPHASLRLSIFICFFVFCCFGGVFPNSLSYTYICFVFLRNSFTVLNGLA